MRPHRVWAEVDLDALGDNLRAVRAAAGPSVAVLLVVKADAYGHGALAVALHAESLGLADFGVGTAEEALELRRGGVTGRILLLGTIVDDEAPECLAHGIELGVHAGDRCQQLDELGARTGCRARVHLNVDTGMGRLGVLPERALELLARIHRAEHLELAGTMTHLAATSDGRSSSARAQLRVFQALLDAAREAGLDTGWVHVGNSAALCSGSVPAFDAVRPGIAAYGMLPRTVATKVVLRPVLSLRSQVIFFKDLGVGATVGYDGTWTAGRPSRIATLPLGYNDGVPWRLGNCGEVLLRGARAPIVGRVSMDYTTVDVTDLPGVAVGDVATLIGRDGAEQITALDVADAAGTVAYEITCSIGKRVPRLQVGGQSPTPTPAEERLAR